MSHIVARMQKMKAANLGGAYRHNERVFENHSNKDIDTERSHLNYELTDRDREVSYKSQIEDYINENKVSNRAIRKDAVLCDEWIITSDKAFFEKLSPGETRSFFETAKDYFAQNYGEQNLAYASVHMDESTPHLHLGVVPMKDGKLSSKAMFDREELKKIQDELPQYMKENGFDLERGARSSDAKHKTVAEFKQELAEKELNLKTEISELAEIKRLRQAELAEINFKASESLSELDRAEGYINDLESHSSTLEGKIGRLEAEYLRLSKQKSQLTDLKIMTEGELGQIKPKKGFLGSERVELTKEQFEEFKGLIYRSKNLLQQKELELQQAKSQVPLRAAKNGFEARLERAKEKTKGETLDSLKSEIKSLKDENSVLRQQNDRMLGKLKDLMPQKSFKDFLNELKAIQPVVKIIKRVIEESLGF